MTDPNAKTKQLERLIRQALSEGMPIDSKTLGFMESNFSLFDPSGLAGLFSNPGQFDIAPLAELLFFPDESLRMKLEKTLQSHRFDRGDEETLIAALAADPPETRFVVRDPDEPAVVTIPAQAVEPFVLRLKIRKRTPPRIAAAIDRNLSGDRADSIKVKLRISTFEWTERRAAFMERFFGAFESLGPDAWACLDFLTSLFEENASEPDVFWKIADRKRYLAKALAMSEYDEGRLEGRNFETRVMTGQRPVFVDRGDASEKIRLADRIALALSA